MLREPASLPEAATSQTRGEGRSGLLTTLLTTQKWESWATWELFRPLRTLSIVPMAEPFLPTSRAQGPISPRPCQHLSLSIFWILASQWV